MKHIEVINDTLEFYGEDLDRRAVTGDLQKICVYQTDDGRRCAIGRLNGTTPILPNSSHVNTYEIKSCLLPEVLLLGILFLEKLQMIHDDTSNWSHHENMAARVMDCLEKVDDEELPRFLSFFVGPFDEPKQ